jgi:hypothetical protein
MPITLSASHRKVEN